jgi:hypothetical protein
MSAAAQQLLTAFDALPAAERDAVMAELLARYPLRTGDLPDAALTELAEELFLAYDAEEADNATPPR